MIDASNLTNAEWVRLNNIEEPRILELSETEEKYHDVLQKLIDYEPYDFDDLQDIIDDISFERLDLFQVSEKLAQLQILLKNHADNYKRVFEKEFNEIKRG